MNSPSLSSSPSQSRKALHWVGPCATVLCTIHCFGTGLIAFLAPGLLKFLPHTAWAEWSVWMVAAGSGSLTLSQQKALPRALVIAFTAAVVISAAALGVHSDPVYHVGLMALGFLPGGLLLKRHYGARKQPACCDHH